MTVKEKREELGISRSKMSRMIGIPIRTLEDWDSGLRTPPEWVERLLIEKLEKMKGENKT